MIYEILPMLLISIIPGYLLLSLVKRFSDVERLALSFFVTFSLFGASGLALHLVGLPLMYSLLSIVPVLGIVLWMRQKITFKIPKAIIVILIVALLARYLPQFLFDHPIVGDSYFHMDLARTFTTDDWFKVNAVDTLWKGVSFPFPEEYRPPFFNFVMGFFFNLFGTSFEIAKFLNVIIGTVAILPAYLIASKYGNHKIAILVSLFLALNPLMINQSMEAEVRIFTVYLALGSFYMFVKGKENWAYSGVILGLLYMTHYAPAAILVATYAAYMIMFDRKSVFSKSTAVIFVTFLLTVSPWLIRNYAEYGDPLYSSSKSVYMLTEFNRIVSLQPPTKEEFISNIANDPADFAFTKLTNVYRTFFPAPLRGADDTIWLDLDVSKNFNILLNPIGMIITIPVLFASFLYMYPRMKSIGKEKNAMVIYVLIGLVMGFLFWNFRSPFTHNFLFQQIVILSICGFIFIDGMKKYHKKIIYVSIILLLMVQIPVYQARLDARGDFGQEWITQNTDPDDVIMTRWTNVNLVNLMTDRKTVSMPFEEEDVVIDFARRNGVDYLIIDQLDLDTKKVSIESMSTKLLLTGEYKIREPEYSRERTNHYWIFKI